MPYTYAYSYVWNSFKNENTTDNIIFSIFDRVEKSDDIFCDLVYEYIFGKQTHDHQTGCVALTQA